MISALDVPRLRAVLEVRGMTQSVLARKSRVSRVQISRILGGGHSRVQQRTLERLAGALGVEPAELLPGGPLEQYRELVTKEHGFLDFRGLGMPQLEGQPIAALFVDLLVREDQNCVEQCPAAGPLGRRLRRPATEPLTATQCMSSHDRMVLVGHPGSGKTTLLRFVAQQEAARGEHNEGTPIYVRLPEFCRAKEVDDRVDFVKYVAARAVQQGCPDIERSLHEELASAKRRCTVLLDGLDEVTGQEERDRLTEDVQAFIAEYPRNRFVVTSRVVGFEPAPWSGQGFAVFRILGYSRSQLRECAEKWAAVLAPRGNRRPEGVLDTLQMAIFSNPRVRALASNPLILTILVLLTDARGGVLPRRRVDLYERVVDVFLETWESNKQAAEGFNDTYSIDLDAREFRWLLSDLSLAMQKQGRTLAARWWLAERMGEYLRDKLGFEPDRAKDACDRIVRYLAERTGLIEERGPDLFAFSHRTLQEYFASLGVRDEADASSSRDVTTPLRGYYFHPQWCEVVRLVAAKLTPPLAESVIATMLDDPDPVGRFLRRGHLLALRCLSDGTTVANRRLVDSIFHPLVNLGKSRWLGITLEVIDVLGSFEGTRLQEVAETIAAEILETAKRELDEDDYECLFEFAHASEIGEAVQRALPEDFETSAAAEIEVTVGDRKRPVKCMNAALLSKEPDKWYKSACEILQDESRSTGLREFLVRELGRNVATQPQSRVRLRRILASAGDTAVRAAAASALKAVTKGRGSAKSLLVRTAETDGDEQVRYACARALADVAAEETEVRRRLMNLLESDQPSRVRAGAAGGLAKAATADSAVLGALNRFASSASEHDEVRVACAWALEGQIGQNPAVLHCFKAWLESSVSPELQRVAAQSLAAAMADERVPWDHGVVERVEGILMGLEDPWPSALDALQQLATAREVSRGLRLEGVLRDSLQPVADRIELAFVFGSTARNRQTEESDVDLFLLGGVTLKQLSTPLGNAERTLGRRVNPVIYSRDSFREKCHAGDPFLLEVCRREKIAVALSGRSPSRRELEDELRELVGDRLASAR